MAAGSRNPPAPGGSAPQRGGSGYGNAEALKLAQELAQSFKTGGKSNGPPGRGGSRGGAGGSGGGGSYFERRKSS